MPRIETTSVEYSGAMHRPDRAFLSRLLLGVLALALTACGDDSAPTEEADVHWSHCTLPGIKNASGLAVLGDALFVCAGNNDRSIYLVPMERLRQDARVVAQKLKMDIDRDEHLSGRELLTQRGYTLGNLWDADVDFQAIATQQPNLLFVADSRFRVVYWGKFAREIGGAIGTWQVRHAFEVPGAKRKNIDVADYRDTGPGISGLFGVSGQARTEDLYLTERARPGGEDVSSQFRVLVLDRYGSLAGGGDLGFFTVDVGEGAIPEVEALAFDGPNKRLLCARGTGRGMIAPFRSPGSMRAAKLGKGVPGPDIEGPDIGDIGRWRGLSVGSDGSWYLVSDGDPAVLAWRKP